MNYLNEKYEFIYFGEIADSHFDNKLYAYINVFKR
jgi:hypothetical protein